MRRDQLEHAIRTACQITGTHEVIVVGSQAILGTYDEDELPRAATMSVEIDVLPIADTDQETERLADLIEGVAGEFSPFEQTVGAACWRLAAVRAGSAKSRVRAWRRRSSGLFRARRRAWRRRGLPFPSTSR